jgi:sugar phosphate isomerase/epimerase
LDPSDKNRKKPLIGFTVDYFNGLVPSVIIEAMKFIGVDFIEINSSIFNDIEKSLKSFTHLKTAFHLPYDSNSQLDKKTSNTQLLIENILKYKEQLNIQHFVCHPVETPEEAELESASHTLFQNLLKLGRPVYFENTLSVNPDIFEQFQQNAKKALGPLFGGQCWDAAHYLVAGYDPIKRYHLNKHQIGPIHLSDCYPDKDEHLPFSDKGSLPIADIIYMLKNDKFNGTITLELIPNSRSDLELYLSSYMMLLKELNYSKYLSTKARLFFLKPFINSTLKENAPNIKILNTNEM